MKEKLMVFNNYFVSDITQQIKFFILLSLLLFIRYDYKALSQELIVKDCQFLMSDTYATEHPQFDKNGTLCAVVKIVAGNLTDLQFPNEAQRVGDCIYDNGAYYVYIPASTYRIDYRHPSYLPGVIDLYNQFGYKAKSGKTYLVTLEVPTPRNNESQGTVVFKISPSLSGKLQIENNQYFFENGSVEINYSPGRLKYIVQSSNYEDYIGTFNVKTGINYVSLAMRPKVTPVEISCNVSSALVYVDNIKFGNVGLCNLPMGKHIISVRANNYIDYNQTISIDSSTSAIQVVLQKNKGKTIDVHPVYVKIRCATTRLYKNNKLLPNWTYGSAIKFMPGEKCLLTDDDNTEYWFTPENNDMEIELIGGEVIIIDVRQSVPKTNSSSNPTGSFNDHEYVDLGLSVVWATCNIGAIYPSDYGSYFAWGESSTKSNYTWENCFDCINYQKYADDSGWNIYKKSGKHIINPESGHDTARENWGGTWRMPTEFEIRELCDKCIFEWTSQNGHNGYLVIGPNGNSIFLPAAGWRNKAGSSFGEKKEGHYWSSSLSTSCFSAVSLHFSENGSQATSNPRFIGRNVRPVTEAGK